MLALFALLEGLINGVLSIILSGNILELLSLFIVLLLAFTGIFILASTLLTPRKSAKHKTLLDHVDTLHWCMYGPDDNANVDKDGTAMMNEAFEEIYAYYDRVPPTYEPVSELDE